MKSTEGLTWVHDCDCAEGEWCLEWYQATKTEEGTLHEYRFDNFPDLTMVPSTVTEVQVKNTLDSL